MTENHECPECYFEPLERKKTVKNNEVREDGWYCPDCEATFSEDTVFEWESLDFPIWISWESYDDSWGMLRDVQYKTGVPQDRIPADEMKYTVFSVWFKITEDGSVEGPYDEKDGELI